MGIDLDWNDHARRLSLRLADGLTDASPARAGSRSNAMAPKKTTSSLIFTGKQLEVTRKVVASPQRLPANKDTT